VLHRWRPKPPWQSTSLKARTTSRADCSNEGIQHLLILVIDLPPHVPHLEPYHHHHGALYIVGLGEGRPPTAGASVLDNSLDPVVTMVPVRGGRAAPPVRSVISVDPAAAARSAVVVCVPARSAASSSTPVWAATTAPVGVRGYPLHRPLSRCFPRLLELHVGAIVGKGRAADATTT
jgi:hypothetical protein